MRFIPIIIAICMALVGCSPAPDRSGKASETTTLSARLDELGYSVANPIQQGNFKVIPIVSNAPSKKIDDVITLEVARKNNWVEITESESASYNAVHVKNLGPKPLLLIAGDLVLGGHQDRVVAHDTIIEPGQEMDVEVFCVEENRSTGPTDVFQPSSQPVPHKVRKEALFAREQSAVWGSVDAFNASAAVAPSTGTVQGGLKSKEVEDHVAANVDSLVDQLQKVPNAVGYVLVVDGKIDSAEVFGGNSIFQYAVPQLMRSVLAQSATKLSVGVGADDEDKIEPFLYEALTGRRDSNQMTSREGSNFNSLARGGSYSDTGSAITGSFKVSNGKSLRGYEIYAKPKEGKKLGALVHGTYAKP